MGPLVLLASALAAPITLTHQGRLVDGTGAALNGTHDLTLALYDEVDSASPFWSHLYDDEPVSDGYYAVILDSSGMPLDADALADGATWLGVTVDGTPLGDRTPLADVPYAAASRGTYLPHTTAASCTVEGALSWNPTSKTVQSCNGTSWSGLGARTESVQIGQWSNGDPLMVEVLRAGTRLRPSHGNGFLFTLHSNSIVSGHASATVWLGIYTHFIVETSTTTGGNDPAGSGLYLIQTRSTGNSIETVNGDAYVSISGPGGFAPQYGDRITFSTSSNNETTISLQPITGHFGDVNGASLYEPF